MPSNSPTPDPAPGTLYVVATPIGHLEDITLRALNVLRAVDLIAAEDTRHTRRLLAVHGIQKRLVSYHEHNERQRTAELIAKLNQGFHLALVSNAGTPAVSDPGFRLVAAAVDQGLTIVPVPGASAAIAALSVSGLPSDTFTFVGFPARRKAKRTQQLRQLAELPHTLIFYQSPKRLLAFLEELRAVCGDRRAVLGREMSKMFEEFLRGRLSEIGTALDRREEIKGECTLLVSGALQPGPATEEDLHTALSMALAEGDRPLSEIAKTLAKRFGLAKKVVYDQALLMRRGET